MKTILLLLSLLVCTVIGYTQNFTYPTSGNANNTTLTAADGVAMHISITAYGCVNKATNSITYGTSHVSTGALHRGSSYSTGCKGSYEIIKLDFTTVTARPAGMQFGIYDVDNNSDSVSVRIFSAGVSVDYTYTLYSPTFINAYGTSPNIGFAGTAQNDSKLDDNRGAINIATANPMVTVDSILIYKYNNRDISGGPSQSYSNFSWNTRSTLPVKLSAFTVKAHGNNAVFNWIAAEEAGTKEYQLQYATYHNNFVEVGKRIAAKGTANGEAAYQYTLPLPEAADRLYFRLKSIDDDGKVFYSKTISLVTEAQNIQLVCPTHFNHTLAVILQSDKKTSGILQMMGYDGKVYYKKIVELNKGANPVLIQPQTDLPKGMYTVVLSLENGGRVHKKVVKQ